MHADDPAPGRQPAPGAGGVTYDPEAGIARVIANKSSKKVANVRAAGAEGARVAICQVDGRRWATLEGRAYVVTEPGPIAEAVARYAERYGRVPRENPDRVLIEIVLERAMGKG